MLWTIIGLIVIGLIAGLIARAIIPGKQSIGILLTIVLGIVGSFVGGLIGYVLFRNDNEDGALQASGLIGSVVGAVLALLVWRAIQRRGNRHTIAR